MVQAPLENRTPANSRKFPALLALLVVWAMCLGYSLLRAPVPGPNEPHYLTKARHFWDPDWCSRDLFLESSNPHAVFYALIGWLPERVGFETTAIIGRVAASLCLALGWCVLITSVCRNRVAPILSMGLLLLFQSLGNLSGEWLVGGVEAKTFSYAFAFLGWGLALRGRLIPAGGCLGLCFSFHPVIGGWVLLATGMAWIGSAVLFRFRRQTTPTRSPSIAHRLAACGVTAIGMLPGLWSSLPILAEGSSPEADLVQVGSRLSHHLDPLVFPAEAWRYYGLLLMVWGLAAWIGHLQRGPQNAENRCEQFVALSFARSLAAASALFAVVAVAIAWGERPFSELPGAEWRAWLLKFYPFRLVDVLLPAIVAMELGRVLAAALGDVPQRARRISPAFAAAGAIIAAIGLPLLVTWRMPYADRPASRMDDAQAEEWQAICQWIKENTPPDALFWAANENWAVKWYAERAEYVNRKDCPQDAASLVEWERRQQALVDWGQRVIEDRRLSIEELQQLRRETGITHIVSSRSFNVMPAGVNSIAPDGRFRVYELP